MLNTNLFFNYLKLNRCFSTVSIKFCLTSAVCNLHLHFLFKTNYVFFVPKGFFLNQEQKIFLNAATLRVNDLSVFAIQVVLPKLADRRTPLFFAAIPNKLYYLAKIYCPLLISFIVSDKVTEQTV